MKSNSEVARAWRCGKPAAAHSLQTDGHVIWSYRLPIGFTYKGRKIALPFQSQGGIFVTQTTSRHVSLVRQVAHETASVRLAEVIYRLWENDRICPHYYMDPGAFLEHLDDTSLLLHAMGHCELDALSNQLRVDPVSMRIYLGEEDITENYRLLKELS